MLTTLDLRLDCVSHYLLLYHVHMNRTTTAPRDQAFLPLGEPGKSVLVPQGISREDLLAIAEACEEMLKLMPPIPGVPEMTLFPTSSER